MTNDLFYADQYEAEQERLNAVAAAHVEEVQRAEAYIARQRYLGAWEMAINEDAERSRREVQAA